MSAERNELLLELPAVPEICERPGVSTLIELHGRPVVVHAVRQVLESAKNRILSNEPPPAREEIQALIGDEVVAVAVAGRLKPGLRRVINATGVILHANLGRAPLAPEAVAAVASAGGGYASLEVDVVSGGKAPRERHVVGLVRDLLECEAATVVNNGAAGVLLALQALAGGRDVLVSSGEMVELGGDFRVVDTTVSIGCRLVPVGSPQRTRLSDYESAIGPETGAILKVQRSSYDVPGFSEAVAVGELAPLARKKGVSLIHDLGSGLLSDDLNEQMLEGEMTPKNSLRSGSSVVCFSGDKLLGGPQTGVVAGEEAVVRLLEEHPLMRALRCDKLALAALEATLRLYRDERVEAVPIGQMLRVTSAELEARADAILSHLSRRKVKASMVKCVDSVGGGTAPYSDLRGIAIEVPHSRPGRMTSRLRTGDPAVLAVMRDACVHLHLRTVGEYEGDALAAAVEKAARG